MILFRKGLIRNKRTRSSAWRKRLFEYTKSGRKLCFVHWFRQYSALAVVVSGVFVVTGTNIASVHQEKGLVSGYLTNQTSEQRVQKDPFLLASLEKRNLSFVPLASASAKLDPATKEEDIALVVAPTDQLIASSQNSPVLKDPEEDGGVSIYTVEDGDTISSIAFEHKITINTILWANDLADVNSIKPGDQIFILPVAGLSYTVKSGDSIEDIAKKFSADKERILAFNSLPANGQLTLGEQIIIPDGRKEEEKKANPLSSLAQGVTRRQYTTQQDSDFAENIGSSGKSIFSGNAGAGHRFPYGYCTWYVAQKRYVPWGGNAGTWLYNAKANGYSTGKAPKTGAIIVTTENRYYGHVALVEKVSDDSITVSEMNYNAWGKVNRRTLPTNSRSIKGYIY